MLAAQVSNLMHASKQTILFQRLSVMVGECTGCPEDTYFGSVDSTRRLAGKWINPLCR